MTDISSLKGRAPHTWTLTAKISLFAGGFLVLSLLMVGGMLWVSWNLQGGAAAVNEAGRLRMMSYRLALSAGDGERARVPEEVRSFDRTLAELRTGNPARPLAVPWDRHDRALFTDVARRWQGLRLRWLTSSAPPPQRAEVDAFVARINAFVMSIEHRLDFWTATLHLLQVGLATLAVLGALLMMYAGYLLVLAPVDRLHRGVAAVEGGDFSARVEIESGDELGDLARGFNRMAQHLQSFYGELEQRVRIKTADLQAEQQRLAALYEISRLVSRAQTLDDLAGGFARAVRRIAGADAAVLHWTDEGLGRQGLLAADGLPERFAHRDRRLMVDYEGAAAGVRIVRLGAGSGPHGMAQPYVREGFTTLASVPVALQNRLLGEVDLLYRTPTELDAAQRSLLEALVGHLASGMESLRSAALEREAAVARERTLLARELHDSIAQALAFLRIQVQLLRSALHAGSLEQAEAVIGELDTGVRESQADVRELLLHFRTRTQDSDIEPALRSTVQKFQLQSGVPVRFSFEGHGGPLDADVQVQVLHIVQEALSNVRKHAHATHVAVTVRGSPAWRFEIADDGCGFDSAIAADATHVGLHIMHERARTIGAALHVDSAPGRGTRVKLELPPVGGTGELRDVG